MARRVPLIGRGLGQTLRLRPEPLKSIADAVGQGDFLVVVHQVFGVAKPVLDLRALDGNGIEVNPVTGRQKLGQFRSRFGDAEHQLLGGAHRRHIQSNQAAVLLLQIQDIPSSQAAQDQQQQADDDARSSHTKG